MVLSTLFQCYLRNYNVKHQPAKAKAKAPVIPVLILPSYIIAVDSTSHPQKSLAGDMMKYVASFPDMNNYTQLSTDWRM